MIRRTFLNGANDAVDDIVDISVVAASAPITKHGHRITAIDEPRELGNSEIGAVSGAICREDSQASHRQAVQVMESVGQEFAGFLGRGVGTDWMIDRVGFTKRGGGPVAIDARA